MLVIVDAEKINQYLGHIIEGTWLIESSWVELDELNMEGKGKKKVSKALRYKIW